MKIRKEEAVSKFIFLTQFLLFFYWYPIKIKSKEEPYSHCYRYENPNDWPILSSASGLTFCKDEIETPSVNCLLDITKGISNPSWYTPVEE